jgi:hypothetical protein
MVVGRRPRANRSGGSGSVARRQAPTRSLRASTPRSLRASTPGLGGLPARVPRPRAPRPRARQLGSAALSTPSPRALAVQRLGLRRLGLERRAPPSGEWPSGLALLGGGCERLPCAGAGAQRLRHRVPSRPGPRCRAARRSGGVPARVATWRLEVVGDIVGVVRSGHQRTDRRERAASSTAIQRSGPSVAVSEPLAPRRAVGRARRGRARRPSAAATRVAAPG